MTHSQPSQHSVNAGKTTANQHDTTLGDPPSHLPGAVAGPLVPWGSPPTPVLPRWYFETLSATVLPPALKEIAPEKGRLSFLGDLADLWKHRALPLTKDEHSALVDFAYRIDRPPDDHTVIPAGARADQLLQMPLRVRTRNIIRRELDSGRLSTQVTATVARLLAVTNFGLVSLLDLMCLIEAAPGISSPLSTVSPPGHLMGHAVSSPHPVPSPPETFDASRAAWSLAMPVFNRLLAASRELNGSQTLAEWLNGELGALASQLGMVEYFEGVAISELAGERRLAEEMTAALTDVWESLAPLERAIARRRILSSQPLTLDELGQQASLTRERIRQIEAAVASRLNHPSVSGSAVNCWAFTLAALLRSQLGPITGQCELDACVSEAFPHDQHAEDDEMAVGEMARYLLRDNAGYLCADGVCVDQTAIDTITGLKTAANSMADEVGIIDEADLKARLPDESWHRHWDTLVDQCGFHRFSGHLALRDSAKAKAKAALLAIGRPATREEVGQLCGLDAARLGAPLSAIPGVVRADKTRWGLTEWVEDEYEGIPAEIIQRIDEDGGATRLERLLEELPRLFDVSESSVATYANTPRFQIRDGYVSLADPSSIRLRDLDDAIHGRSADGLPYWSFKVESRYFDGYSLVGLPPEIAKALGCEPDGWRRIPVSAPSGCDPVSVRWPLASVTGASLGYLAAPLGLLGAQQGDRVQLVLETSGSVTLQIDCPQSLCAASAPAAIGDAETPDRAKDLLERMKNRRKGL